MFMKKGILLNYFSIKKSQSNYANFKKIFVLFVLTLAISIQSVYANGAIGYKGIYINSKTTKTWYKVHNVGWGFNGCGDFQFNSASDFNAQNLGSVSTTDVLQIAGFALAGWTDGTDWVAGALNYKIWKQGDTEPVYTQITVGNYGNGSGATQVVCSSGNDRMVGYSNGTTNINPGSTGTYNFKVQGLGRMQWSGGNFNVNDGTDVTATFTVTAQTTSASDYFRSKASGSWNTAGTWESSPNNTNWITSTLVPGTSATAITILSGHNVTLDTNATISGLVINSGGTFTASDATPRTLTITKSTSGSTSTLTNSGTWENGSGGSTVVFTGAPSSGDAIHAISGTIAFQNLTINKTGGSSNVGASFGANSSVSGTLEIGSGGFISSAPPTSFYDSNAILKFNQGSGATYNVNAGDYSWSTTVIPNYITISSGTVNLNANRTASGNLLIDGGALVLNLNTPNLTIQGNWTRSSGSFTANSGTVTLSGTTDGAVNITGGGSMNNLIIAKTASAKVILESSLTATTVTINSGSKLTLNVDKTLTVTNLNINSDGTNGTGTFIENGTLSATTINVQQYLNSARNWYISSPLTDANAPVGYTYYKYLEPGNNTDFVAPASAYWALVSSGTALSPKVGYIAQAASASTITFTGSALNNGSISKTDLSRTTNATKLGFNLVGNPYPSYLNWTDVTKSNLNQTMWYKTHDGSTYKVYTYSAQTNVGSPASVTRYIPPMQGFWVRVESGTGTIGFTNSIRSHSGDSNPLKAPAQINTEQQIVRLQVSNGTNSDEAVVLYNANASNGYDDYDSPKMTNNDVAIPEIYTIAGTEQVVINGLNSVTLDEQMPLGFTTGSTNTFTIKATELSNFDADKRLILLDTQENTYQDLTFGSTYTFSSTPTTSSTRFKIVFKSAGVIAGLNNNANNSVIISTNESKQILINRGTELNNDGIVTVYNALGQKLVSSTLSNSHLILSKPFNSGVYVVCVNIAGINTTKKVIIK